MMKTFAIDAGFIAGARESALATVDAIRAQSDADRATEEAAYNTEITNELARVDSGEKQSYTRDELSKLLGVEHNELNIAPPDTAPAYKIDTEVAEHAPPKSLFPHCVVIKSPHGYVHLCTECDGIGGPSMNEPTHRFSCSHLKRMQSIELELRRPKK